MVASSRNLDQPHLFIPGKAEGGFHCPQWNGLAVCSHVLVTPQSTLLAVVSKQQGEEKNGNLTALARLDMPANPGKKGRQSTSRVRPE